MFEQVSLTLRKLQEQQLKILLPVPSMILTTECMVVDKPEEKPQFPMIPVGNV